MKIARIQIRKRDRVREQRSVALFHIVLISGMMGNDFVLIISDKLFAPNCSKMG